MIIFLECWLEKRQMSTDCYRRIQSRRRKRENREGKKAHRFASRFVDSVCDKSVLRIGGRD